MRGRARYLLVAIVLVLYLLWYGVASVVAMEGTSYTYTLSRDRRQLIPTLDAYLPAGIYLSDIGLNAPEDMFLSGETIYIADSGNGRIVICNVSTGELESLGEGILQKPTGIVVSAEGRIVVADYGAQEVVVFDNDKKILTKIGRPEELLFGANPYKPRKVALDSYGNLFVISEGTHEGILQFDPQNRFCGFFGANRTKGLNLVEWFQKTFYSEEQKAQLTFRTPPNIVSMDIAENDMVFSVTQHDPRNAVKKLNMAGVNVYRESALWGRSDCVDVAVLPSGGFYAVSASGWIDEYDEDGNLILEFGGTAIAADRNGLTAVVSAIDIDNDGNIYVLDQERGLLQVWYPTEYALLIQQAEADFRAGFYEESYEQWQQVFRINPSAFISTYGCARALFQMGRYTEAADLFSDIEHKEGYSDCFWEMRSAWFRAHMKDVLIAVLGLSVVVLVVTLLNKKIGWKEKLSERVARLLSKYRMLRNLTEDVKFMIRHPIDGVYYLKIGQRGSLGGAAILYGLSLVVYMVSKGLMSFLFGGGYSHRSSPLAVFLIAFVPLVLFVSGSYLISSVNDGEGSKKQVFIVFGYCLSPYVVFWPILTLVSHVLTLKEIFVCDLLAFLIIGYAALMIVIAIKELHDYSIRKTMSNIFLTFFFMVVAILAVIILYILWRELISFVSSIFEEVRYRVTS